MGGVVKGIGRAVGGVVNNTVGKLPVVGGAATHIGNALSGKEPLLKGLLSGGAPLLLGAGTFGLGPAAGLMSKIGGAIGGGLGSQIGTSGFGKAAVGAGGKLLGTIGKMSPGQLAGLGAGAANMIGAGKQRKSAEKYLGAQTDLRNQLMSRVLSGGGQTYNFAPEP